MTTVTIDTKIAASAEKLWEAIGKVENSWPWSAVVSPPSEGGGKDKSGDGFSRSVKLPTGGSMVQRLEHVSEKERIYLFSITESPLPIADCVTKIRVIDNGDGTSTVQWSSNFTPMGANESDAARAVRALYESGVANLKRMFPT